MSLKLILRKQCIKHLECNTVSRCLFIWPINHFLLKLEVVFILHIIYNVNLLHIEVVWISRNQFQCTQHLVYTDPLFMMIDFVGKNTNWVIPYLSIKARLNDYMNKMGDFSKSQTHESLASTVWCEDDFLTGI